MPKSEAMTSYPATFLKNQIPVFDDDEGWDSGSSSIVVEKETRNKDKTELTSAHGEENKNSKGIDKAKNAEENKNSKGIDKAKKRNDVSKTDLFIPIFAMVSLAGFAGLYLYETLRLYSEGELYLPGMNN